MGRENCCAVSTPAGECLAIVPPQPARCRTPPKQHPATAASAPADRSGLQRSAPAFGCRLVVPPRPLAAEGVLTSPGLRTSALRHQFRVPRASPTVQPLPRPAAAAAPALLCCTCTLRAVQALCRALRVLPAAERRPGVTKCPGAGPRHRTADQPRPAAGGDLWAAVPPPSAARRPPVALREGWRGRHRANRQLKKPPHSRAAPPDKVRSGGRAGTPRRSDRPGRCPRTPCGCPTPLWLGGAGQVRSHGHLSAYTAD